MKIIIFASLFCLLFCVSAFSQESQKIDEFENLPCDEYLGRIDFFISEARKNPSSTIYVLVYEGKVLKYNANKNRTESVFPTVGSAKAKISSIKKRLEFREVEAERFRFVKAGFRENSTVEIWLVPDVATPPKATPTLTKMKYRKGKAFGFCLECCGP
ncbi:MAG TPA: hypothetical protein VF692_11735 [Pyrinomonadaceae bacterium]|jgi:hypothetical protein